VIGTLPDFESHVWKTFKTNLSRAIYVFLIHVNAGTQHVFIMTEKIEFCALDVAAGF
jgi:hypothetical protein